MVIGKEYMFTQLIAALSMVLDMEENQKLYHAWRVGAVAAQLAALVRPQIKSMAFYGGLLHDIGAMGLDDHIVHQKGKAADPAAERIIHWHSDIGAKIVRDIPGLDRAAAFIEDHHERWDGQGFPYGKKGDQITLGGQLIGIADQFDLILRYSRQPRRAKIVSSLERMAGTYFSPQVVELFKEAVDAHFCEVVSNNSMLETLVKQNVMELSFPACPVGDYRTVPLKVFAQIIDAKHRYTGGHSVRVAHYATEIGKALGLASGELDKLHAAALLHDFGKVAVPPKILDKPGPLTDYEFQVVRQHPANTIQLLQACHSMKDLALVAGGHHERYDGKGYPLGLSGDAIPLGGRLIALADALDAMTSNRPYQKTRTFQEALDIIRKNAGTQFDPNAVDALLTLDESRLRRAV